MEPDPDHTGEGKLFPLPPPPAALPNNKTGSTLCFEVLDPAKSSGLQAIFKNFSLNLPQGRFTVIMGPSGCGKSTLEKFRSKGKLKPMKTYYRALTIAGSDSGGGAGVQADLKTFSALGVFGMSAITALTAQNTHSVTGIFPVPPAFIGEQIDAVMSDIGAHAVKIGMLHSPEVIEIVAGKLKKWQCPNVVLDPVMISKSGDNLLQDDAVAALTTALIPLATVMTPNLPEASVLLGRTIDTPDKMEDAAVALADLGAANVLVKGGHLTSGPGIDLLYEAASGQTSRYTANRVDTKNSHGTGCTLSSAIAAGLARGLDLKTAVAGAKTYITEALKAGADIKTGSGHGPVHHFYALWERV